LVRTDGTARVVDVDPTLKGHTVKDPTTDLSDAVVTFLKNHPGPNEVEFRARFGADVPKRFIGSWRRLLVREWSGDRRR
jgi:hypothetical protein